MSDKTSSLEVLDRAFNDFNSAGGSVYRKTADDPAAIHDVAEAFGLELPNDFREFYRKYQCIAYGPEQLISVARIADQTSELRTAIRGLPKNLLLFIDDGSGAYYFISCRLKGKPEPSDFGAVLYVPCHRFDAAEFKASTFTQFVLNRLEFWKDDI